MKKRFMRMISMLMILVMTLGMCVTGYAADEKFSITVDNSIGGVEYTVYKIFDATYSGEAISYTIKEGDPWYSLVNANDSPFTLTASADGSCYVVSTTASSIEIGDWFNALEDYPENSKVGNSKTGTGGSITFDLTEPGYYLVVPVSEKYESVAVAVTSAAPDATVMDKNQEPGGGESFTKTANGYESGSYSIGDTIDYVIESYVPTYNGEYKIVSYEFTDTMGTGLTLDATLSDTQNSDGSYNVTSGITVTISGSGLVNELNITDDCTIEYDNGVLTISYEIEKITNYPADASIKITYKAIVNGTADETNLNNIVDMNWYEYEGGDEPVPGPDPTDPPETGTTGYIYGFDLKKTDGATALSGAEFTLADSNSVIYFVLADKETNTYEVCEATTEGATINIAVSESGELNIWGLAEGNYTLTETKAPAGYNILTNSISIVISSTNNGWTVTANGTTSSGAFTSDDDETDEHGIAVMPYITVVNNAGTTLPGTGGIGTTIFYMVGTLLVLAAAALVVAKMRLGKTE